MRFSVLLASSVIVALESACGARTQIGDEQPPRATGADATAGDGAGLLDGNPFDQLDGSQIPDCPPNARFLYTVTDKSNLFRFDPDNGAFQLVAKLACPTKGKPHSMAVSRAGVAYVLFTSSKSVITPPMFPQDDIFEVDTVDASCKPTAWVAGTNGFGQFGMGFAMQNGQEETLYVAQGKYDGMHVALGAIDVASFDATFIGFLSKTLGNRIELTSSDDGQLYGYLLDAAGNGGYVIRIDKKTANVSDFAHVAVGSSGEAFALAYWRGDFLIFTGNGPTTVARYQPSSGALDLVGSIQETVVGAGVSTCSVH